MIHTFSARVYKLLGSFMLLLLSLASMGQDKKIEVDIKSSETGNAFFMQPWAWVIGGAVFLLLLVALLRNNNSKA